MESDYLKLSQFLYHSYQFPLETTRFLIISYSSHTYRISLKLCGPNPLVDRTHTMRELWSTMNWVGLFVLSPCARCMGQVKQVIHQSTIYVKQAKKTSAQAQRMGNAHQTFRGLGTQVKYNRLLIGLYLVFSGLLLAQKF